MRKHVLSFLFVMLVTGFSRAQENRNTALISLKNGTRFRGFVKPELFKGYLTLYFDNLDSLLIPYNQISRIKYRLERKSAGNNSGSRIFSITEMGLLFANIEENGCLSSSLSAQTILGFVLFSYLKTGIGISFDQYNYMHTLPVFLSLRGDLLNRPVTPFYYLNTGYGSAWGNKYDRPLEIEGGKMIELGMGINLYSIESYSLVLTCGYKIQDLTYVDKDWLGNVTRRTERTNYRLKFTIGIGF